MFRIIDLKKGIFQLVDQSTQKEVKWKLSETSKPAVALIFNKNQSEYMTEADYVKKVSAMSEEEFDEFIQKESATAIKNLVALASLVDPIDEIPEYLENKIEFLALCMTAKDPAQIYAFFLIKSADYTAFHGQFGQKIKNLKEALQQQVKEANANNTVNHTTAES